jgi:alkanesulfonate monooxygenase SsuD/methylene tetrahydromethanopterin reductase-like flavin-dependent oxidoreductase (luciferase family)
MARSEAETVPQRLGVAVREVSATAVAEIARAAEDAGFTDLLLPETGHAGLSAGITGRDPFLLAAAALRATSTLRAGPGVAASVIRPARLMALAAATAHEESDGRFLLGCGVTHRPAVEALGVEYPASPLGHVREYLAELRRLSTGGLAFGTGFPIILGALGDKMIATAATCADAVALNWLTVDAAAGAVARYREASTVPGGTGSGGDVALLVRSGPHGALMDDAATYNERLPNYRAHFVRQGLTTTEDVVRSTCMSEDPAAVADRLAAYRAVGVTIPCLYPSGLSPAEVVTLLRRVGAAYAKAAA